MQTLTKQLDTQTEATIDGLLETSANDMILEAVRAQKIQKVKALNTRTGARAWTINGRVD